METETNNQTSTFQQQMQSSRKIIRSFKAKADANRSLSEKIADWMTGTFGSVPFFIMNAIWFFVWIVVNLGLVPGITPFDPFPFGLLTMIVSLEAIMLATFVLISQNRSEKIDDLREEIDVQVDMLTEQEVAKVLELLKMLLEKNNIDVSNDRVLQDMLNPNNTTKIERALEKQMSRL